MKFLNLFPMIYPRKDKIINLVPRDKEDKNIYKKKLRLLFAAIKVQTLIGIVDNGCLTTLITPSLRYKVPT